MPAGVDFHTVRPPLRRVTRSRHGTLDHARVRRCTSRPKEVDDGHWAVRLGTQTQRARLETGRTGGDRSPPAPGPGQVRQEWAGREFGDRMSARSRHGVCNVSCTIASTTSSPSTTGRPPPARMRPTAAVRSAANRLRHRRTDFGLDAHRRAISAFETPSVAHNNALAWRTSRAGGVCERASRSS